MRPDWIAVDWGTSSFRTWAMSEGGEILAQTSSDRGMGNLQPSAFEAALLDSIGDWLDGPTEVIACGMVGARQGWIEAPYHAVPTAPLPGSFARPDTQDPRLNVHIIAGLSQDKPADVMRGEETQIAGFVAQNPKFDGILCLPGTHTKWAHISAEEVVSFQTFMTGEIFSLLSSASVLRHSVSGEGWDGDAFIQAVDDALSHPEKLAARLFSLRAEGLLHDMQNATARARLSGLLIGAELAAARPYWLGQDIALIGAERLSQAYAEALRPQGITPRIADATTMTLAGLTAARAQLKEA